MRLATQIHRTPFGRSNADRASAWYGGSDWESLKAEQEEKHRYVVAQTIKSLPGTLLGVHSGFRETGGPDLDGRQAEWWSVVIYDGPAEQS